MVEASWEESIEIDLRASFEHEFVSFAIGSEMPFEDGVDGSSVTDDCGSGGGESFGGIEAFRLAAMILR